MKRLVLGMAASVVALLWITGCAGTPERTLSIHAQEPHPGAEVVSSVHSADTELVQELHRPVPMNRIAFQEEVSSGELLPPVGPPADQHRHGWLRTWVQSHVDVCRRCNCCILDEPTDAWRFETAQGGHAFRPSLLINRREGKFKVHLLRFENTTQAHVEH